MVKATRFRPTSCVSLLPPYSRSHQAVWKAPNFLDPTRLWVTLTCEDSREVLETFLSDLDDMCAEDNVLLDYCDSGIYEEESDESLASNVAGAWRWALSSRQVVVWAAGA